MDPRDSNRGTRKKSKWVQDLIKEEAVQPQEVEHVVGRNQSAVMEEKSTTDASSAHATKTSAINVPNIKKKEEDIAMEAEFAEKLSEIKRSIDDSQARQTRMLNQTLSLLTDYINHDVKKIVSLESDNRYNQKVLEDMDQLKTSLKTYKTLFWGLAAALMISVIIYLILT